ncbi:WD repeat-containing protein 55,WD repeat-containing protein 55 homolog [Mytilus edulis]|uniref:WD repeat-containing protein 55,WD repeat-containing protein 55 homolog n=1 Tax=Mytilus edulis TaxID=6550 RepID=A0A8S3V0P3_MYTED|nr:WD repeat-containing protein 55,WD repeat-containing protein 55 homolog [Mytilus edulis]
MMDSKPNTIKTDNVTVDLCFHPKKDVLATGDMEGDIRLYSYPATGGDTSEIMTLTHHKKACRCLRFSNNGEELYTASKDKSIQIIDLNTGGVKHKFKKAHDCPVYSMLVTGEHFIATGDDDGVIKIWDVRINKEVVEIKENEDFISDMGIDPHKRMLLATSGDGTLTAYNIRRKKLEMQSELFDSEFLTIAQMKNNQKVVCGSGDGVFYLFNWGEWGNMSDMFPALNSPPVSLDCMVALTDDIIVCGCDDGNIRAINILPNRIIGVVGDHEKFPVENISLSHDKKLLASCSHDQTIKFWNIDDLDEQRVSDKKKKKSNKSKLLSSAGKKDDFFSGLAEGTGASNDSSDDDDSEDDDDDDSEDDNSDEN